MSGGVATSVNIKHKLYSLVNVHLYMNNNQRFPSSENINRLGLQPSEKEILEKEQLKYRPWWLKPVLQPLASLFSGASQHIEHLKKVTRKNCF